MFKDHPSYNLENFNIKDSYILYYNFIDKGMKVFKFLM